MDLKPFFKILREYAEVTTINGVLYVFNSKFSRISQFFWFLVGIALIVVSLLLILQSYNNWQGSPILTTVSTTGYPISKIDYPAITICGLGRVDSVLESAILNQVIGYIEKNRKIINFTLENGETYLDLLATAGLNYTDFVTEEYPGMSDKNNLSQLFMEDFETYLCTAAIKNYDNELQKGINFVELLNASNLNYQDFFNLTYPGLIYEEQPQYIILQQMALYFNNLSGFEEIQLKNIRGYRFIDMKNYLANYDKTYETFLAIYYPGMPSDYTFKELISSRVTSYIYTKTYSALEALKNPSDIIAAYKTEYSMFLTERYPGFSPESNITDIMEQKVIDFIKQKTELNTTLQSNQTYKDLFPMSYTNFLAEMYPGLDENINLNDLIQILAAPQPDAFLLSMAAVSHNYTHTEMVNESIPAPCDGMVNYEYDSDNNICYRYAGLGSMDQVKNGEFCLEANGEEVFNYESEEQFKGFLKLVRQSVLLCATNPADATSCMDSNTAALAGVYSYTEQWTACQNALNCCWVATPNGPSCFYSTSLHVLVESKQYVIPSELQPNNGYENVVGQVMWTSNSTLQGLTSSNPFNNITPSLELSYNLNQGDSYCYIIIFPGYNEPENLPILGSVDCAQNYLHVICQKPGVKQGLTKMVERNVTLLDNLINPNVQLQLTSRLNDMKETYVGIFNSLDFAKAKKQLLEILWYSQLPCFEANNNKSQEYSLIKRCEWKGVELPCSVIFKTFPTDRGMCCTFNMAAAEDIFYNSTYLSTIADMQSIDSSGTNAPEDAPDFDNKGQKPIPSAGMKKGLSLILDAHSDLLASGSVAEDYQGFLAVIGSSNEYPLLNQDNIYIRPGHYNLIGISGKDVQATENIRSVSADNRNCYFDDEYKLALHKNYSQPNCILECQMSYASSMISKDSYTDCTPWFLPKNDSSDICNPWVAEIFVELMSNVPEEVCDHCLPDCTFTDYEAVVTAVEFRKCNENNLGVSLLCNLSTNSISPPIYAQQLANEYNNKSIPNFADRATNIRVYNINPIFLKMAGLSYDAYAKDIAEVNFYFKSSKARQLNRDVSMTWIDFAGQIGGFLGLCDGFSVCSLVEIFFWFVFRLWYNATAKNK